MEASINDQSSLKESYVEIDKQLAGIEKERVAILGDGHCLPRAVFRGAKLKDLVAGHISYKSLFRSVIDSLKHKINDYKGFLEEDTATALRQLDNYFVSKQYSLPSNILDACIHSLADQTACQIVIYYLSSRIELHSHIIEPTESHPVSTVELVFIRGHYDLVVQKSGSAVKHSPLGGADVECIVLSDSPCKLGQIASVKQDVKTEFRCKSELFQEEPPPTYYGSEIIELSDDEESSTHTDGLSKHKDAGPDEHVESGEEGTEEVSLRYFGKRKYVDARAFNNVKRQKVDCVPHDVDGLCVFVVPFQEVSNLKPFKGARPWGKAQSSRISGFDKGPRLLFNCRGSYICPNLKCPNLTEFGINRADFMLKDEVEVCKLCGAKAQFLPCDGRLIIEKDLDQKIATIYHHGDHSCVAIVKGRPNDESLKKKFEDNPRISRETLIRQSVQTALEINGYKSAVDVAKQFTDTTFVDNAKKQLKWKSRPEGSHSFAAVQMVYDAYKSEDKFLVYDYNDGANGAVPFIMKSSKLKVELMIKLDKDGSHPLSGETVHLDVLHSRCKGWKTYTLSYYDKNIREMVRLAIMETSKEDWKGCECFFKNINRMIREYLEDQGEDSSNAGFNPYHLKDDEHGGNKIGMKRVFGEEFVRDRTSSCQYHLDNSIQNHKKYVNKEDQDEYKDLWYEMLRAITRQAYKLAHRGLSLLIERQQAASKKPLSDALRFWHDCRFRWATSFRSSLQGIPLSSLAEPAQAAMKAGCQRNISLVDSVFADIVDAARLEGKWQNRTNGERSQGSGPSAIELNNREECRQMQRSAQFLDEMSKIDFSFSPGDNDILDLDPLLDPARSHRPDKPTKERNRSTSQSTSATPRPKVSKARPRSIECTSFQKLLKKAIKEGRNMKVVSYSKSSTSVDIELQHSKTRFKVQFSKEFTCDCSAQQRSRRVSCIHIIWCLLKVFKLEQNDRLLAQLTIGTEVLNDLLERVSTFLFYIRCPGRNIAETVYI